MSTQVTATIRLNFESEKQLTSLLSALTPETEASPTHRSTVQLQKDGTTLTLVVEAEDTVALRATLNAYMHWIQSILNVLETVKK
jgi:tRNA threonylcarbamoyladenosine modification (KEOPS) complex  Pcc1 subunit